MEIYIKCTNKACSRKINTEEKYLLKEIKKCPACGTELPLDGSEAQEILLAKELWAVRGKLESPEDIMDFINYFYNKLLEMGLPEIFLEETVEEKMKRKAIKALASKKSEPTTVVIDDDIDEQSKEVLGKPVLNEADTKQAEANAKSVEEGLNSILLPEELEPKFLGDGEGFSLGGSVKVVRQGGSATGVPGEARMKMPTQMAGGVNIASASEGGDIERPIFMSMPEEKKS